MYSSATINAYNNSARAMPSIDVTIAVNKETFTIKISDRGKGQYPKTLLLGAKHLRTGILISTNQWM